MNIIWDQLFPILQADGLNHITVDTEPSVHIIWGWMQIEDVIPVDAWDGKELKWAGYHPHFHK